MDLRLEEHLAAREWSLERRPADLFDTCAREKGRAGEDPTNDSVRAGSAASDVTQGSSNQP
jgi:hypothetical protein